MQVQRGIRFSGEMITEVLSGKKTETRRTSKLDHINEQPNNWHFSHWRQKHDDNDKIVAHFIDRLQRTKTISCPYGSPGDVLYFAELKNVRGYLKIDEIKVERLEDISEESAKAEGVQSWEVEPSKQIIWRDYDQGGDTYLATAQESFWSLFCTIYGREMEVKNPWLWCLKFHLFKK